MVYLIKEKKQRALTPKETIAGPLAFPLTPKKPSFSVGSDLFLYVETIIVCYNSLGPGKKKVRNIRRENADLLPQ